MENNNNIDILDIKPLLNDFLEYLYPCNKDFISELETSKELIDSDNEESDEFIPDLNDEEKLFPYPYFDDFERTGYKYIIKPKPIDIEMTYDIKKEMQKYENNHKRIGFWRLILMSKGLILSNVICLFLRSLEAIEFKKLYYGKHEIVFYGVTIAKMKKITPMIIAVRNSDINNNNLNNNSEEFSIICEKTNYEKECFNKLLFIKLKNGNSIYFDYSFSDKADKLKWNKNGFPCNMWKPYKWKNGEQAFSIDDTISAETLELSFTENFKGIELLLSTEKNEATSKIDDVRSKLSSKSDLFVSKEKELNDLNEKNDLIKMSDDEIALFVIIELYINRVYENFTRILK